MHVLNILRLLGNTNSARFEIFALLGEAYGSGLPLAYLIIRLTTSEHGVKERFIRRFLEYELKSSPAHRAGGERAPSEPFPFLLFTPPLRQGRRGATYIQKLLRSSWMYSVACTALRAAEKFYPHCTFI